MPLLILTVCKSASDIRFDLDFSVSGENDNYKEGNPNPTAENG
jgi:hypothetical protein